MGLTKETPPESKQHRTSIDWQAAVKEMKASPHEWFKIGEFSPGIANHIRKGVYPAFLPADIEADQKERYMRAHWEIAARVIKRGESRVNVYARWMG